MKKIVLTLAYIFPFIVNAQQWEWVRTAKTTAEQHAKKICVDYQGSIFILGRNSGNANFTSSSASMLQPGYFILKYDKAGNYMWSKAMPAEPKDIGTDKYGNLYAVGNFTANFFTSTTAITLKGVRDFYVMKLEPNGTESWTKSFGGKKGDAGDALSVSELGDVYVTGFFTDTIKLENYILCDTANSQSHFYLLKLDQAGNIMWATKSLSNYTAGFDVCVDKNDNSYAVGEFIRPNCDEYCLGYFFMKFAPNGSPIFNNQAWEFFDRPKSINVDNKLNLYIVGWTGGIHDAETRFLKYSQPLFLSANQSLGLPFFTCQFLDVGAAIDSTGNSFYMGTFGSNAHGNECDSVVFGSQTIHKKSKQDLFIMKYKEDCTNDWSINEGGSGYIGTYDNGGLQGDIAVDPSGNCYIAISYNTNGTSISVDDKPTLIGKDTLKSDGNWPQILVAKLKTTNPIISNIANSSGLVIKPFSIFPNPNSGQFTLVTEQNKTSGICVYDLSGNCVHSQAVNQTSTQIDLSKAAKGIYFVEVNVDDKVYKQKLIVQ